MHGSAFPCLRRAVSVLHLACGFLRTVLLAALLHRNCCSSQKNVLAGLSLYPMVSPLSSVTSPPVLPDLWFQFLSAARSLILYTTSLTLVFLLPRDWFQEHLSGLASPRMSPTGPEVVYTVNEVRFSNMFTPLFPRFLFLPESSVTFTWTWLGLFLVSEVSLISCHNGQDLLLAHEALPLPLTSAKDCARALISSWISRFGVPVR